MKISVIKKVMMLKYIINYKSLFLLICLLVSCSKKTNVNLLVSENNLRNLDSIYLQTPYKETNIGSGFRLSNLPMKLNGNRDYKDWNEITEKYRIESHLHIDSINSSEIRISRSVHKWVYINDKRITDRLTVLDFKKLLAIEGIQSKDFEIKNKKEIEYDSRIKNTYLELWYNGTVNKIKLLQKGQIDIRTYLISQIPYWETQGYQFSTTKNKTIEKYSKKK